MRYPANCRKSIVCRRGLSLAKIETMKIKQMIPSLWLTVALLAIWVVQTGCDGTDSCFVPDTMISTPNGDVPIQNLKVGDEVYAYDHQRSEVITSKVTQTFVHHNKKTKALKLPNGKSIGVTSNHPIYASDLNTYIPAGELDRGQMLVMKQTSSMSTDTVAIEASLPLWSHERGTVYNISVAGVQNYFAEGLLVHNKTQECTPANGCYLDAGLDSGISDAGPSDAGSDAATQDAAGL